MRRRASPTRWSRRWPSAVAAASCLIGSRVAQGMPGRSQYAATKAALVALARSWAREVAANGVTVNVVSPAATATAMLDDPARAASAPRMPPLGRLIEPAEIAELVAFLLSPAAAAITGQEHPDLRRRVAALLSSLTPRPMKIVNILESTRPIRSDIRNAYIDFSKMTLSLVAVVTDVIRDGRPVVGYGFNSNGRYGQGGLIRERFVPRLARSRSGIARRRQPARTSIRIASGRG